MDMDTKKDTNKDTEKDIDKDTNMDKDTDTDTWNWNTLAVCYISIWRCSPYSAVWIICDSPQCKFQRRYEHVAPLPDENYDMQILKCS